MPPPPTGTVCFLFTDIEGSTRRWQAHGGAMAAAVARHDAIVRDAVEVVGGHVFKTVGDAFCAAFARAGDALAAAVAGQRALAGEDWGEVGPLRVRMALHAGAAEERDGDYFGPAVNRVARLLSAGHGGQVLLSQAAEQLVRDGLPGGVALRDLGEHRLKDLERPERVFQVLAADLVDDFPPLATLDRALHNLPGQPTSFVGRERDVAALKELMGRPEARLVTLTGPGGTGKTRLALQVAAEVVDHFPDGVWFVPLAAINDPALVPSAIAEVLGIRESGERPLEDLLTECLREKRLLLVLDNVEQLLPAAASGINRLMGVAPNVTVLATSRAPLRLRGEKEIAVSPLGLPKRKPPPSVEQLSQYAAVVLFIERAQDVRADFTADAANAPAIAEICHRLDGLPLAIELAAARIRLFSPQAMLGRLEQRLPLLTGGARDLPERQQTLRAAIAWSYDLLTEDEQKLYRRLSVFSGGWTLEAAEAVAWSPMGGELDLDVLSGLERLVEHSLIRQQEGLESEPRFTMLETIREYGLEQLERAGEAKEAHQRHAGFFAALAGAAHASLIGPGQVLWLNRLEAEHDNVRAALEWSLTHDRDQAHRIAGGLWRFWGIRGHLTEGRRWLEAAIALRPTTLTSAYGHAVKGAGSLAEDQAAVERALALYVDAVRIARAIGDRYLEAQALDLQGNVEHDRGRYEESIPLHAEAQRIFEEVGDKRGAAGAAHNLGSVRYYMGDLDAAEAAYAQSLDLIREAGDLRGVAIISGNLAAVMRGRGDFERSLKVHEDSLHVLRELGDEPGYALGLTNVAECCIDLGDLGQARAYVSEALEIAERIGARRTVAAARTVLSRVEHTSGNNALATSLLISALTDHWDIQDIQFVSDHLSSLGSLAGSLGDPQLGVKLVGAAHAARERLGITPTPIETEHRERLMEPLRAALDAPAYEKAWQEGAETPLEEAVAEALALADELAAGAGDA